MVRYFLRGILRNTPRMVRVAVVQCPMMPRAVVFVKTVRENT